MPWTDDADTEEQVQEGDEPSPSPPIISRHLPSSPITSHDLPSPPTIFHDLPSQVKKETKATIRCFPLDQQHRVEGKVCFMTGRPATHMALFARAF